ncbi:hypothetical protein QUF70_02960 [Desulfobacterales bacterium HSG17]|nr:hypothetical protein [Desulfobacterales bacterium HSG17]
MKKLKAILVSGLLLLGFFGMESHASIEWNINKTIQLENQPLDMAISKSGKFTFVLTDVGDILIYDAGGTFREKIQVGTHISKITPGPNDNTILISSKEKKTAQVLYFAIPVQIDTKGSPTLGKQDAPVEVVVFSDFQ